MSILGGPTLSERPNHRHPNPADARDWLNRLIRDTGIRRRLSHTFTVSRSSSLWACEERPGSNRQGRTSQPSAARPDPRSRHRAANSTLVPCAESRVPGAGRSAAPANRVETPPLSGARHTGTAAADAAERISACADGKRPVRETGRSGRSADRAGRPRGTIRCIHDPRTGSAQRHGAARAGANPIDGKHSGAARQFGAQGGALPCPRPVRAENAAHIVDVAGRLPQPTGPPRQAGAAQPAQLVPRGGWRPAQRRGKICRARAADVQQSAMGPRSQFPQRPPPSPIAGEKRPRIAVVPSIRRPGREGPAVGCDEPIDPRGPCRLEGMQRDPPLGGQPFDGATSSVDADARIAGDLGDGDRRGSRVTRLAVANSTCSTAKSVPPASPRHGAAPTAAAHASNSRPTELRAGRCPSHAAAFSRSRASSCRCRRAGPERLTQRRRHIRQQRLQQRKRSRSRPDCHSQPHAGVTGRFVHGRLVPETQRRAHLRRQHHRRQHTGQGTHRSGRRPGVQHGKRRAGVDGPQQGRRRPPRCGEPGGRTPPSRTSSP